MNARRFLAGCLIALALLGSPQMARACPLCADAIANANKGDEDNKDDFPTAMNESIYLMIGVPYTLLFLVGFMIYRGVKKNDAYRIHHGLAPSA